MNENKEEKEESLCKSCTHINNCPSHIDHPKNGNLVIMCVDYDEEQWHKLIEEIKPPECDYQHPTDMHY